MTWQRRRNRIRFVDEDQILIHSFWIERTLKHKEVFGAYDAMLDAGREVKPRARLYHFDRKRSLVRRPAENKTGALADFESLVLLFVHLEREISAFADDEIFFHARMFVKCD